MPKSTPKPMPCWRFFKEVLSIDLTPAQRVLVKVSVDGLQIADLDASEVALAEELFALTQGYRIDPAVLCRVIWLLGRGSGKSTLCSGVAIYLALTLPMKGVGPGSVPIFAIIAADKGTAVDTSLSFVRAMIAESSLQKYVARNADDRVDLRRPDGRLVRIQALAPSKGGKNVRGRDIIGFMLDEAQFFNSDPDGRYAVNDRDVYGSLTPRLLTGAIGFFVSTPWPTENLMSELFEKNYSHPVHAIAAKAPTPLMRPDKPDLPKTIAEEMDRDPDTARREYFCDLTASFVGAFFDRAALEASVVDEMTLKDPKRFPVACCIDLAFAKDSSTISIVQWDGETLNTVFQDELRPTEGLPLKPSFVLEHFADVARAHGCRYVLSDGHYREAAKEAFAKAGITLVPLPEGATGKNAQYLRTKAMLDEGKVRFPAGQACSKRFLSQATAITAKARGTGTISISSPRRASQGHGDLVSSWVGAVHHLSYAAVRNPAHRPKPGEEGHKEWLALRIAEREARHEAESIREAEHSLKRKNKWRCT